MATGAEFTGPVNIGNPDEIPIRYLADRVIQLAGSRSRTVFKPLPQDDPTQRCPDITLAKRILGWEPDVKLDDGLSRTIGYFDRMLTGAGGSDNNPA
jgi:UDP-glucuronate decarboxylase